MPLLALMAAILTASLHAQAVSTGEVSMAARPALTVVVKPGAGTPDRDDTAAVLAALEQCRQTGARRLVFERGQYLFHAGRNPANPTVAFVVQDMHNLTIDGQGSELLFSGNTGGFLFVGCGNIRVQNLIIDYERPGHSVGTVIASAEKHFDVEVLPEFPVVGGEPVGAFMTFDPATRLPCKRGLDVYNGVERTELLRPQVLRVHLKWPIAVPTGLLVALRHSVYGPGAFVNSRCSNMRFRDITIYSVPGMGLIGSVCRNITAERFRVLLKPGTQQLVSATADGSHFGGCKGTITMKDCEFEGMGDDAVNIKSGLYLCVRSREDERTVLAQHNLKMVDSPDPGDAMELAHVDDLLPYATATVESVEVLPGGEGMQRVRFREALPADMREGDVLGNASRVPRVRISGCSVRNNRARGFLIQTRNAVIEGCHFQNVTGGGVWVMTEVTYFFESIGTRDITVRGNTFGNCGYGAALGDGVIGVFAWLKDFGLPPRPGVHRDILVEGNTIRGGDNSGIWVTGADGITIRGNTLVDVCRDPTRAECGAAISVMASRGISIEGNTVDPARQGAGYREGLRLGQGCDVDGARVEGNTGF